MLADPYAVRPWRNPCRGSVRVPGSKSLTNRALILAALGKGRTRLQGALFSRDTRILVDALRVLGFEVGEEAAACALSIVGRGGSIPRAGGTLFVGNSGTSARFLTALVCLHPAGVYHFDGDEEMYQRPMEGLIDALRSLGARFTFHRVEGCFPFTVETAGLRGGSWSIDAGASSQMLSALMMVAPFAAGQVVLKARGARPAFVEMTAGLLRQFGIRLEGTPQEGYVIAGGQAVVVPDNGAYAIEPDASAASYFLALPAVTGGELTVLGLREGMLQGDIAFAAVLRCLGMKLDYTPDGLKAAAAPGQSTQPQCFDFETFSDTFLTLAAIAPLLPFPVRIEGIGHTRHQETDRLAAMATELRRTGALVEEGPDYLAVEPFAGDGVPADPPVIIRTYKDHRVAMSFAILGSSPRFGREPWLHIADPSCCGKTFPGFFGELENLYQQSHDK